MGLTGFPSDSRFTDDGLHHIPFYFFPPIAHFPYVVDDIIGSSRELGLRVHGMRTRTRTILETTDEEGIDAER